MGRSPNKNGETVEDRKEEKQKLVGRLKIRKEKQKCKMEWKRKDRKVSRTSGNKRWETGEDRRTGGDERGEDSCQPEENDPVGWWRDLICFSWLGIEVLRMEVAYQPMGKIWLLRHCYYVFLLSFTNSFPLSSLRIWSDVLCELLKMFCFEYIYDIIARKETTVWQQVLFLLRSERKPELWNTKHYLLQKVSETERSTGRLCIVVQFTDITSLAFAKSIKQSL